MRAPLTALILAVSAGAGSAPTALRASDRPRLTVMTYNVNYGLAGDAEVVDAIRSGGADLILLQETTRAWERSLEEALAAEYPHRRYRHHGGAGGQAVLSRFPVREAAWVEAPSGWFPGWVLHVDGPFGPVQVLAVHLRPPVSDRGSWVSGYFSTPAVRRTEIEAYVPHLDPDLPTLIAGDFNEGSGGRALTWLGRRGFEDALVRHAPRARTWRWQTSLGQVSARLDHVLHDERLRPVDGWVLDRGRSDHLPVVAVFEPAASSRSGR